VRTYFETLLHRKQGEYGPLWLFELDSGAWAIVWEECLNDEAACRLILSEDPNWFNREWHKDGRRPNPTYETPCQALEEIIQSLQTMKEAFDEGDVKRSHYSAYVALAEYHLHTLEAEERSTPLRAWEGPVSEVGNTAQLVKSRPALDQTQPTAEPEQMPLAPALQAAEVKKPWELANSIPTSILFKPEATLHSKMDWICNNVPKMSRLRILREGAELLCNRLIEKHYK
jgi:hypothetical protein